MFKAHRKRAERQLHLGMELSTEAEPEQWLRMGGGATVSQ